MGERYGERAEVVLDAFAYVKELRDAYFRGIAWHDRHADLDHPAWDANWEKTEQRGRAYGAASDELSDWLGCTAAELREVFEYDEAQR